MTPVNVESKVESGQGETPVAISADDVLTLVEEGLEVHQAVPDCNAGGNAR